MTPEQIAKTSEHSHQAAFFCWAQQQDCKPLEFMHAIPNGGLRNKVQASHLKAEGVRPGVPDVCLPYPCGQYHGLYLEFKKPGHEGRKDGGLSKHQIRYRDFLKSCNYAHKVVYSWLQAAEETVNYLNS